MTETFTLKCGTVLELQPPSADAIRNLLADDSLSTLIGNLEQINDPNIQNAILSSLSVADQMRLNSGVTRLFNYCVGWGVATEPPPADVQELRDLGFPADTPRVARVNWLRYLKISSQEEAGELMGTIMALAIRNEQPAQTDNNIDEVAALKQRIAELESARVGDNGD